MSQKTMSDQKTDGWQPIETAPKAEGTRVLLLIEGHGERRYVVEAELVHGVRDMDERPLPAQWVCPYEVWGGNTVTDDATHWMPIPEPPR